MSREDHGCGEDYDRGEHHGQAMVLFGEAMYVDDVNGQAGEGIRHADDTDGDSGQADYGLLWRRATMLAEAERIFYQLQAKGVFLRNSDRCIRFFHDLVKRTNKRNAIIFITKQSEEHVYGGGGQPGEDGPPSDYRFSKRYISLSVS